jgi:hypothetical protein
MRRETVFVIIPYGRSLILVMEKLMSGVSKLITDEVVGKIITSRIVIGKRKVIKS